MLNKRQSEKARAREQGGLGSHLLFHLPRRVYSDLGALDLLICETGTVTAALCGGARVKKDGVYRVARWYVARGTPSASVKSLPPPQRQLRVRVTDLHT